MSKYLDNNGLLYFWQRIKTIFAKQTDLESTNTNLSALQTKVDNLVSTGGEPNVIETVKVNGSALPVTEKAVDITVPTNNNQLTNGAGYQTAAQVGVTVGNAVTINTIQVNGSTAPIVSKTVNISVPTTVAQLSDAGDYALKSDISHLYEYKGAVATVDDLPTTGNQVGDVYDVEATGMNYAWNGTAWDPLGQMFTITSIGNSDIDAILAA